VLKKFFLPLIYSSLLLFSGSSCNKTPVLSLNYTTLTVALGIKINNSFWTSQQIGYACGGERSSFGKIYKTINAGQTWNEVYTISDYTLYDICFVNDSIGYCCGQNFKMYYTTNYGQTWKNYNIEWMPLNYQNSSLRSLRKTGNRVLVVGGDNFNIGISFPFAYDFFDYRYSHPDAELRGSVSFDNNKSSYLFGYGFVYKSTDTLKTYFPINLTNDFFTGCCAINSIGYACGYDGGIYKSTNAGANWEKIKSANMITKSRYHLNSILFTDELKGWCTGDEGLILKTTDGKTWSQIEFSGKQNLISVRKKNANTVVISTSNGELLEFN
jgi:photosystem II stability/assembly factor-like uncharacterized protein